MADTIKVSKGQTAKLVIAASGDSLVVEIVDKDVTGVMITSHGTFSATSTALKASLDEGAADSLSDGSWKTINADISSGVAEVAEPWPLLHCDTMSFSSGALNVYIRPY